MLPRHVCRLWCRSLDSGEAFGPSGCGAGEVTSHHTCVSGMKLISLLSVSYPSPLKLFRPEAPPSEGPQYVNKAFSAYRGIYIEKEDMQMELNKLVCSLIPLQYFIIQDEEKKESVLLPIPLLYIWLVGTPNVGYHETHAAHVQPIESRERESLIH